jgi:hypothetical protein
VLNPAYKHRDLYTAPEPRKSPSRSPVLSIGCRNDRRQLRGVVAGRIVLVNDIGRHVHGLVPPVGLRNYQVRSRQSRREFAASE